MVFTVVFLKFAIMLKKYFSILFVFLVLSLAVLSPGCKRKIEDVESEVIEGEGYTSSDGLLAGFLGSFRGCCPQW